MAELTARDIGIDAGGATLVANASLSLKSGELVVLLGPNGAGKTSLLRAMVGVTIPASGEVALNGDPIASLSHAERARRLAYLPQQRALAWSQPVRDVVTLGRFAHGGRAWRLSERDRMAVEQAMDACDVTQFAERAADTLSGGELARVHLARAMAGEAGLIVADEPVASLDPRHQHGVMALLRDFVANEGGAMVVLHDLDLAARYADRLVWMSNGRIVADGTPIETLTLDRIATTYGVSARLVDGRVLVDGPHS